MSQQVNFRQIGATLKMQAAVLGSIVLLFWGIELVDSLIFNGGLDFFGVRPRSVDGLWGILFGPFLHVDFPHVLANTAPFLVLGWFIMVNGLTDFVVVSLITAVISGLGTWLIAPSNSVHVGASGVIFGYFGFLVLRGYFERSFRSIIWSIVVIFLYGGLIWGVLPQGLGISWQGHLFGFIGGGYAAYWFSKRRQPAETAVFADPDEAFDIRLLGE